MRLAGRVVCSILNIMSSLNFEIRRVLSLRQQSVPWVKHPGNMPCYLGCYGIKLDSFHGESSNVIARRCGALGFLGQRARERKNTAQRLACQLANDDPWV
jgi:hypothetical protein